MQRLFWTLSLVSAITLAACATPSASAPEVATGVAPAAQTSFLALDGVVASAKAVPLQESQMSFSISAPVTEVLIKEGDLVQTGQTLITLYAPDLELSVTSAELELRAAELDLVYWLPRYDRPPERREQARAEVEHARAKLETAKAIFAQSSLLAPFNATVADIKIRPGELAQAGQVVITLGDLSQMQMQTTDLSERDILEVQAGQSVIVFIEALNKSTSGKVMRVSPLSDTVGGDVVFPVTIELDEQAAGLLWGMSAEVEIQTTP